MTHRTRILIFLGCVLPFAGIFCLWIYPLVPAGAQARYPAFVRNYYQPADMALSLRKPGQDQAPPPSRTAVDLEGTFQQFDAQPAESQEHWPAFRGEYRDNIYRGEPLRRSFGPEGPPTLWSVDLGEGYAGPAVRNGRVYLMDYDQQAKADALRCFSLADGKELWRRSYPILIKRQHGMSRTVPAVTDDYVVTLGPKCHVLCCRADSGEFLWGLDLVAEYGTTVPPWYAGQCPLIDDGKAILAPGGKALMVAVDCETGEVVWETPNPDGWEMTHTSILPVSFLGRTIYIYAASGGVVGIDAETGEVLFRNTDWTVKTANVPSPVDLGNGRLFLSGGYGEGSMFLQLKMEGADILAETGQRLPPTTFGSEQQTPIFYEGHIYGVLPKVGANSDQMTCLDDTGATLWVSGPDDRFGLGAYIIADGLLLAVDDDGVLTIAEARPDEYRRLARAKVLPGHEAWGPMAVVDGRLLLRDLTTMVCLDMREKNE